MDAMEVFEAFCAVYFCVGLPALVVWCTFDMLTSRRSLRRAEIAHELAWHSAMAQEDQRTAKVDPTVLN